jgi:CRISPR-associated protein Csx10
LSLAAKAHTHSAWQTSDETGIPDALLQEEYCPVCRSLGQRSPLFALSGYYIPLSVQNAAFTIRVVYPIHQRIIAGTSINRVTGTAQQGMLFSRNVLEEGQYFSGRILVADDTPESALEALMSLLATDSIVRVGTGRSRGLGKLQVVKFDPLAGNGSSLAERWQAFNTQARDMGLPDDRVYFSLTLLSHWLRDANPFHPATGLPDGAALGVPAAKLERSVIRHTTILGWNAARRLPKESQQALARGSVLLFSLPPGEADEAQTVLARLEETGLGERQGEGYGQLAVCHPFHYQTIQVQGEVNS